MEYQGKTLRHELKYAINHLEYSYLRSRLKTVMQTDRNASSNGDYHIRSLYFDDLANSAFEDKEAGVKVRGKYRLRIYNHSDQIIKLEFKEKFNNLISKSSRTVSRTFVEKILQQKLHFCDVQADPFLQDFYLAVRMNGLRPKLIVDYIREPYISRMGNVRITFDKQLQAGISQNDLFGKLACASPILTGSMILEVKYDDFLPEHIRSNLQLARHQLMAVSKYTLCREFKNSLNWKELPL